MIEVFGEIVESDDGQRIDLDADGVGFELFVRSMVL